MLYSHVEGLIRTALHGVHGIWTWHYGMSLIQAESRTSMERSQKRARLNLEKLNLLFGESKVKEARR